MKISQKPVNLIFLLILISLKIIYPQQVTNSDYEYISPVPESEMNMPETNIIIRLGKPYNSNDVFSSKLIEVTGDKSGLHSGKIILAENNKILLFTPDVSFQLGETVSVRLVRATRTEDGQTVPSLNFSFKITENNLNELVKQNPEKYLLSEFEFTKKQNNLFKPNSHHHRYSIMDDSLPEDFPNIQVDSLNNPSRGFIFSAPFYYFDFASINYLIISDNFGMPVFYRQLPSLVFDFKKQNSGLLTYYHLPTNQFFILDSSYNVIDSLYMQNGYITDTHELLILENGHSLMMAYDFQSVRMDTVVPGGDTNAVVIGLIVQEQDENKNVVFQWRSWDHFQITDATFNINLTNAVIDYVHGNAIEVDDDENLLISCRNMDEVTKINRQTGDIIWRWGGEHCENNQFTFVNDPIGFSHQHDIRKLENGNYTVFDNGNLHSPQFSRFVEYQLDEVNKFVFLVWEYSNEPLTYSAAMGNASRLQNHNTIIGWGIGTSPAISEVTPNGEIALFLSIPDTIYNYRGFKFPWKTNLFVGNSDSLYFGYVPLNDSLEMELEIINNSDQQIEINSIFNRDSAYSVLENLPFELAPFGVDTITVKFKPELDKDYFDGLHLRWETEGQRIAQVIPLIGSTDPNFTNVEAEYILKEYTLSQNYPNPFNPSTTIRYQLPEQSLVTIKVYDILGREVVTLVNQEKPAGSYEVQFEGTGLTSGIYFYQLKAGENSVTKKMILLR